MVSLFADRRTLRTMRLTHWNQQQRRKVYHTRVIHRAAVHELDIGARTRLRAGDGNTEVVPASLRVRPGITPLIPSLGRNPERPTVEIRVLTTRPRTSNLLPAARPR